MLIRYANIIALLFWFKNIQTAYNYPASFIQKIRPKITTLIPRNIFQQ